VHIHAFRETDKWKGTCFVPYILPNPVNHNLPINYADGSVMLMILFGVLIFTSRPCQSKPAKMFLTEYFEVILISMFPFCFYPFPILTLNLISCWIQC